MTWIELGPRLALMLVVGWLPGLVWVGAFLGLHHRAWTRPRTWLWAPAPSDFHTPGLLIQLAIAPAVTWGFLTVAAFLFSPSSPVSIGAQWDATTIGTYLFVVTILGTIALAATRGRRLWGTDWRILAFIGSACFLALAPMMAINFNNPLQQWDPAFHANAVWVVLTTHDANPLAALSPMFGASAQGVFYPSLWHGFVAMFADTSTIIPTINLTSVTLVIWWIIGMAGLAQATWGDRGRTELTAIVAALTLAFPADFISMYAQWPNATSMALTPGLLAGLMLFGRGLIRALYGFGGVASLIGVATVMALGCIGVAGVHPIGFFNVCALTLVMLISNGWRLLRASAKSGNWWRIAGVGIVASAGIALVLAVFMHPTTRATSNFQRKTSWIDALFHPFAPLPPLPASPGFVLALITTVILTGIGLWSLWSGRDAIHARRASWITWTWGLFAALVFLAYAPDFGAKILVGPWYSDPRRLMGMMQAVLVLVMVAGLSEIAHRIRARWSTPVTIPEHPQTAWEAAAQWRVGETNWRRFDVDQPERNSWRVWLRGERWKQWVIAANATMLACLFVLMTGVGALDARILGMKTVYDPNNLGPAGMASEAELNFMRSADQLLTQDALILGDPANGTVYFEAMGNRRVVFPHLSIVDKNPKIRELARTFHTIGADPTVCETIRDAGITHFYAKPDSPYYQTMRSDMRPGFYGVDTSRGFHEIGRAGDAVLYEITACR